MAYPPSSAAPARPGKQPPRPTPSEADMQALAVAVHARLVAKGDLRKARWIERAYDVSPAAPASQEPTR